MMNIEDIKRMPYGVSEYAKIREENLYYVDKTRFIREIEKKGFYLFFIRPRRFGKSLFLSTLECYYDILRKKDFDTLFEGTAIHQNPTPKRNSYLILKFDFSKVNAEPEKVENSFNLSVKNTIDNFLSKYQQFLNEDLQEVRKAFQSIETASDMLDALFTKFKNYGNQIYVIIDEYDNFANTLVSSYGEDLFHNMTHGEGFFRAFFHVLKGGTGGDNAPVSRIFMTGVSPITLAEITSSFNIAEFISLDHDLSEIIGFTHQEIASMIEYYKQSGLIIHSTQEIMEIMYSWYDGYCFSKRASQGIINSTQALFFLKEYMKNNEPPEDLIDQNLRIDYHKLRYLIIIDQKGKPSTNGNFSKLKEIIANGKIESKIKRGFPLNELISPENFISLLYYFGLLTISGSNPDDTSVLTIPNETVKRLYYDYIKDIYKETNVFNLDIDKYTRLMSDMAFKGQWNPLFTFLTGHMANSMGLRDLITGEKACQSFLNVYLGLSNLFIIHSEKELCKGFADLVMEPFIAKYPGIGYSYIIELKYLPPPKKVSGKIKIPEGEIRKICEEAEAQLKQYCMDEKFQKSIGKTTLVKLVLIFSGHKVIYIGEAV